MLPSTIQVGPYTFSVAEDEHAYNKAAAENEGAIWGYIRYGKCQIILDPQQAHAHKQSALLHELLHAIWHLSDWQHEGDEKFMRILATGLLDTMRRNPELVKYLTAEEE